MPRLIKECDIKANESTDHNWNHTLYSCIFSVVTFFPAVSSNGHSGSNWVQTGSCSFYLVVRRMAKLRQHRVKMLWLLCQRKDNVGITLIVLACEGHIFYSEMSYFDVVVFFVKLHHALSEKWQKDKTGTVCKGAASAHTRANDLSTKYFLELSHCTLLYTFSRFLSLSYAPLWVNLYTADKHIRAYGRSSRRNISSAIILHCVSSKHFCPFQMERVAFKQLTRS